MFQSNFFIIMIAVLFSAFFCIFVRYFCMFTLQKQQLNDTLKNYFWHIDGFTKIAWILAIIPLSIIFFIINEVLIEYLALLFSWIIGTILVWALPERFLSD